MVMRYSKKTAASRRKFSQAVLERDEQCRVIINGKRCTKRATDAHHTTGRISVIDDVPEAGLGTCREHHSLITDGILKVCASWLTQNQIDWIEKRKWPEWKGIIWDQEPKEL